MLAQQIELANETEGNPFRSDGITTAPQDELYIIEEDEEGDSDVVIDWLLLYLLRYIINSRNIFFDLKLIFWQKLISPLPNKPPPLKATFTNKPPGAYSIIYGICTNRLFHRSCLSGYCEKYHVQSTS